jgi:REP element-mobilizing transposase RayT
MRSRYRVHEPHCAHFITTTVVEWLPVFTTSARCDILVQSFEYCRKNKGLKIYAWVILDNHIHAIVAAPELTRVITDFKRHTAQRILDQLEKEKCEWLLNQFRHFRLPHKVESIHQFWQEGFHPQAIANDQMMDQKLDYVHGNPVQRGLMAGAEHWRYSSAHEWLPGAIPALKCHPWE